MVHFEQKLSALTVHFLSKIILINPEQSLILKQDVNLQCGLAEIGPVFDYFLDSTDREDESTSVHVMFLGDQLENSDESLFLNRPKGDNNLVLVPSGWNNLPKLAKQANILGCGDATSCDRVLDLETVGAEVESFVTREGCLDRVFSSLLSCSEFHMKIEIPKCAFQGLEITDLHFANQELCNSNPVETETHFSWEVNYSDCGTVKGTWVNAGTKMLVGLILVEGSLILKRHTFFRIR